MNQSTHLTFRSRVIERFPLLSCSNAPPHSVWPGGPFCRPDARNMSPSRRERKRKETRVKDGWEEEEEEGSKEFKNIIFSDMGPRWQCCQKARQIIPVGISTLITFAPWSAICAATAGAATTVPSSITLIPRRARGSDNGVLAAAWC